MNTVRELSGEYLNTIYELNIFLKMEGHSALGERLVTCAVELATLSHIAWANFSAEEFRENLVRTHEMADKITTLLGIVDYLELGYSGMQKVREDTEAIYRMSKASINTIKDKKNGTHSESSKSSSDTDDKSRPTRVYKASRGGEKKISKEEDQDKVPEFDEKTEIEEELKAEGNDTVPEDKESGKLPFEVGQTADETREESA